MDRQQMMAALQQAMPGVAQATLDALSDEQLADLVKNLPSPTPAAPAAPPAPAAPFAEGEETESPAGPSRKDMIAELVELGEDAAELDALSDDELGALYDEMTAEAPVGPEEPVEEFADPASAPREELIAELVAMGQDAAQLEVMPEEELRALATQLLGGATPAAPPAPAPVAPMSERRRTKPRNSQVRTMSETARYRRKARELFNEADLAVRELRRSNHETKKQDAESFCDRLIEKGQILPAQRADYLSILLPLDNLRRVHKYSENGQTRTASAYELKKIELAKRSPILKFGERFPKDPTAKPDAEAEVAKVRQFAETLPDGALKAGGYKNRNQFVEKFAEMHKKDPEYTADKLIKG